MKILDIVFVHHLRESDMIRWHSRVHRHEEHQYELHCFISGSGSFRNGNAVYSVRKNQVFLSYPSQVHSIIPNDLDDPITYYAVLFELDPVHDRLATEIAAPHMQNGFPHLPGSNFRLYLEDMKNKYVSRNAYLRSAAEHGLFSFLFDILGRIENGVSGEEDDPTIPESGANVHVEQAMDLFQKHIEGTIRLSDVGERLRISEEHLIKLFRKTIGITPMKYYQNIKMEAAMSMLLNSRLSIKEISWRLGYSSPYHFSRNFKLFSNSSPTDYRKNYFAANPARYLTKPTGEPFES